MPILTGIYPSKRKGKRLTAYFENPKKTIHFGSDAATTFIDGATKQKRDAYIARHSKSGEDWSDPLTAGTLALYLLWSTPDYKKNVAHYKKHFEVKIPKGTEIIKR